jgi:hypothetical protein
MADLFGRYEYAKEGIGQFEARTWLRLASADRMLPTSDRRVHSTPIAAHGKRRASQAAISMASNTAGVRCVGGIVRRT